MDYKNVRLEMYKSIGLLMWNLDFISEKSLILYKQLNNIKKLSTENIELIKKIYENISNTYNFTKKYNLNNIKCIVYNFKKEDLSKEEISFLFDDEQNIDNCDFETYIDFFDSFKNDFLKNLDYYFEIISTSKFYSDHNFILTDNDKLFTGILGFLFRITIEIQERKRVGYILKMILNPYDYNLFRNALSIFYDDTFGYNDLIRGKYKIVTTFDENEYDYIEKNVENNFYNDSYDSLPTEDFEKKTNCKYDEIINFLSNKKN